MGILAAEILVPEIVVRVELHERDRAVFFGDGAEDGEADGVISTDTDAADTGAKERSQAFFDADEGVFDGERIDREVTEIGDAVFRKGLHSQDGIPGSDDGGLDADVTRAEARAGSVGGAAVERNADQGDVEFIGLRDMGQAHEGGDAGETSVAEGVERLRMRQVKGAGIRFGVRHAEGY